MSHHTGLPSQLSFAHDNHVTSPIPDDSMDLMHAPLATLGAPSIGGVGEEEQGSRLQVTLDAVPPPVLELFWSVGPAKSHEIADVVNLNHSISLLLAAPVLDYGWAIQTYYALLELRDSLWAQFVVLAAHNPPQSPVDTDIEGWKRAMSPTMRLIPQAILRLEAFVKVSGLGILTCIKKSRATTYPHHHPYRIIEKYLRFGERKSRVSAK